MKFTEVTRKALIVATACGAPKATACALAGIDVKTLKAWLRRGEVDSDGNPLDTQPGTEEYVEWRREFLLTEGQSRKGLVDVAMGIAKHCDKPDVQLKAVTWLLERMDRPSWGYKATIEHEHSVEDLSNPDTRKPAIQELRAMGPEMTELMIAAWCGSERDGALTQAPGGLRQIWEAVGERYGWTNP